MEIKGEKVGDKNESKPRSKAGKRPWCHRTLNLKDRKSVILSLHLNSWFGNGGGNGGEEQAILFSPPPWPKFPGLPSRVRERGKRTRARRDAFSPQLRRWRRRL
uniref:Uncharacterized protein n=1 Tax=Timema douglasi TaxID=61478 RepID=A0A7R8VLV6_TIMDO|nr:unnamed protein product [Timema douglasi]